ncbi:MAG: membrane-bound PQQ-dependent dehydrogenase, glucose/quinate/shikimate family, partial [Gluconacetobacter diazotrophicus]|nr:membrane-bound PQQ-dependent dehydrogenase, glucose/quinate/shikimate family [Gluconacetobacter diazotrophicus]
MTVATGSVVCLLGLLFLGLGAWLAALGGNWYYVVAGAMMTASGILIARNRIGGVRLYGLLLAGTVIWALAEVGFDGWALIPRLVAPAVLGFWICLPWIAGRL